MFAEAKVGFTSAELESSRCLLDETSAAADRECHGECRRWGSERRGLRLSVRCVPANGLTAQFRSYMGSWPAHSSGSGGKESWLRPRREWGSRVASRAGLHSAAGWNCALSRGARSPRLLGSFVDGRSRHFQISGLTILMTSRSGSAGLDSLPQRRNSAFSCGCFLLAAGAVTSFGRDSSAELTCPVAELIDTLCGRIESVFGVIGPDLDVGGQDARDSSNSSFVVSLRGTGLASARVCVLA